jgi:serine O-acetyltransferase
LYYLKCDKVALGINRKFPKPFRDEIWRFEIALRKAEYYHNTSSSFTIIRRFLCNSKFHRLSVKLGFSIPLNVFGPGLAIVHRGTIVVAGGARIGANCRIHEMVTIGATNRQKEAATIGNNVFIASGAKIIGAVTISDNVAIAANAVVVKDIICDQGCTVGGVPARIISPNSSRLNLIPATDIVDKSLYQ